MRTRVVRRTDPEWPPRLEELGPHEPPRALYVRGLPLDPQAPAVAVVGTRRPTGAGLEAARRIATGIAEAGWRVVSGLAVGIDAVAHRAALDAGGETIAVLGCGLDVNYPARNSRLRDEIAAAGTLISEYPAGTPPSRHHFPLRNRIIAGLSVGVVVVEGSLKSGALVTARLALDANRNVYAVPGSHRNPMAEGPNELIRRSQAALVTDVGHVFEDLAPGLAWTSPASQAGDGKAMEEEELSILRTLDDAPLSMDHVASVARVAPGRVAVLLAGLEVRGMVSKVRGGYALGDAGARALRSAPAVMSDTADPP